MLSPHGEPIIISRKLVVFHGVLLIDLAFLAQLTLQPPILRKEGFEAELAGGEAEGGGGVDGL